jgi:hypothetical protein
VRSVIPAFVVAKQPPVAGEYSAAIEVHRSKHVISEQDLLGGWRLR